MLDLFDLGLEDIKRLCQTDLTWELIPLYDCAGKEGKACAVFICSQLAILMFSSSSTSLQIPIFINGNEVIDHICINLLVPSAPKINIENPGNKVNYWGVKAPH